MSSFYQANAREAANPSRDRKKERRHSCRQPDAGFLRHECRDSSFPLEAVLDTLVAHSAPEFSNKLPRSPPLVFHLGNQSQVGLKKTVPSKP